MSQIRFPRPLAFAFSGGLARAASQIGMCQVATELGIRPDLVVGTSTGAINGAVFAQCQLDFAGAFFAGAFFAGAFFAGAFLAGAFTPTN